MVPKKGFTPQSLSKSFHFNEIPLSIEYTNLSHFSILSTWSTCSMGCYGFRLKVATTPSKNVEKYGHHHVSSEDSTRVGCQHMYRDFGIESQNSARSGRPEADARFRVASLGTQSYPSSMRFREIPRKIFLMVSRKQPQFRH